MIRARRNQTGNVSQRKIRTSIGADILRPDQRVEFVKTPTLHEFPDSLRGELLQECFETAGCFKSPEEAEKEVQALEDSLLARDPIVIRSLSEVDDDEFMNNPS